MKNKVGKTCVLILDRLPLITSIRNYLFNDKKNNYKMKHNTKVNETTKALLDGIYKLEASNLLALLVHDKPTAAQILGIETHYGSLYNVVCAIFEKSSQGIRDIMNAIKAIHETALINSVYAFLAKFKISYKLSEIEFGSSNKAANEKYDFINATVAKNIYRTHKAAVGVRAKNGYHVQYLCARQIEITKFQ